jgi:broad specificity phosphatase PhoE
MKTVYFVRHGQSEGNVGMYFQGEKSPLTEFGRKQAAFVARRCKGLKIDAIISSSMERAQETAGIISNELKTGFEFFP